jgi:hypothetical protein
MILNVNTKSILDTVLKGLLKDQPNTFKALYPKRIQPPSDKYLNPKYYAASLLSELLTGFKAELHMIPHVTGLINSLMQMQYRVPTYFVQSEFAQAVIQTEPPDDFVLDQIKWPLPAMTFVLPVDFSVKYFGYAVPFISVTRSPIGIYPQCLKNMPACDIPLDALNKIDNQSERINIVSIVVGNDGAIPMDYVGSFPTHMNIRDMDSAPFEDATYLEEQLSPDTLNACRDGFPTDAEDKQFNAKVQMFAIKLLLAMTARPHVIKLGALQRPEKRNRKGAIEQEALWQPNCIGWDYKAQRVESSGAPGAHASPRMHWRRGHMRNQPFGPKPWNDASPKRLTWIEPVLINAPEVENVPQA